MDFADLYQQRQIRAAQRQADHAAEKAAEVADTSKDLRARVEALALANQALFEILHARLGITAEEILRRMTEIDARDGTRDGIISPRVITCRQCGRTTTTARRTCMHCGATIVDGPLFAKA